MVPPVGIIITVSVLLAASLAAYENPQVRAWIDRTRHKIAMSLHSLGDEIQPRPQPRRTSTDASMHEDKSEVAGERRRQAIADIMERGRQLEERRKRRKLSADDQPRSPTFDTMVDDNGVLLQNSENQKHDPKGRSSGIDVQASQTPTLRQRSGPSNSEEPSSRLHSSVDMHLPLRQLSPLLVDASDPAIAFESRYEQEMREAWNIPLSDRRLDVLSSHASESLIQLTPTTEEAPDPDFSIPSAEDLRRPLERSEYFSAAASNSTHTLSEDESQPPFQNQSNHQELSREFQTQARRLSNDYTPASLTPSIDGSLSNIHASEVEDSSDGVLSEIGDGVRTPASAWTEVESNVSSDFHL